MTNMKGRLLGTRNHKDSQKWAKGSHHHLQFIIIATIMDHLLFTNMLCIYYLQFFLYNANVVLLFLLLMTKLRFRDIKGPAKR